MTKILMVCLGNICRSPLAHGILESKLPDETFYIDSAGTSYFHIGEQPNARSIETARRHGIDITHQRARQFDVSDFDTFDYIYVMDQSNYQDVVDLARDENDTLKIKLILDEIPNSSIKNVPDPYNGDNQDFEKVYQMLEEACEHIVKKLR